MSSSSSSRWAGRSASARQAPRRHWAGLGDSYAAGPLIPNQQLDPLGCLRSDHNLAHLAAATLGRSLADASCSGATTADMTAPQDVTPGPANPPQLDALTADTQIVTLQIGGNDIGFTSILENCATANPFAHPCRDKYVVDG
ncbi:MAG TPA: GDSL-type esterase/lipase family protein, partial [Solirubrobacteraceae bacterium]